MRAEAMLFCHHSIPRASTEPGASSAWHEVCTQTVAAGKRDGIGPAWVNPGQEPNPTLKPQRGHSPGIRVSDKQDKEMKCKPSPKEPRRLGHWLCDPIVEYTALDRTLGVSNMT